MRLKTENWREQIHAELKTSSIEAAPLFNTTTNSLLGESFDIPIMDNYDSEGIIRQIGYCLAAPHEYVRPG